VNAVTDVHTHALPLPLLRSLERAGLADLSGLADGFVYIDRTVSGLPAGAAIPCPPEQHDVAARLAMLDAAGVGVHLVSAPPFVFGSYGLAAPAAQDLMRRTNDALAEFVGAAPDRLRALGMLVPGLPGAVDEVRRCREELGMAGFSVGSQGIGGELDHPDHEPLWKELAAAGAFTLLHPGGGLAPERLADFYLTQLLGFPLETTLAATRLIFGGVLDRHDLRLCLAHGGGCMLAAAPRLDLGWHRKPSARTIPEPPSAYLRRFYYDTAVFDARVLRRLVDDVGADRVLLGSDAPFDLSDRRPRETVAALGLEPADARAILAGNLAGIGGF
jgi:aminocarboxymuconate-semialdehyde decarboxylase